MHISRIKVPHFRALKDVDITFEKDFEPRIFPLASQNGGGKSTLLQLIFILLHCSSAQNNKHDLGEYICNLLADFVPFFPIESHQEIASIEFWNQDDHKSDDLSFFIEKVNRENLEDILYHTLYIDTIPFDSLPIEKMSNIPLSENQVFIKFFSNKNCDYLLMCESQSLEASQIVDFLQKMREKVFLMSPISHVFLFLERETRKLFFKNDFDAHESYFRSLQEHKKKIGNLYIHDFISIETLTEAFKIARDKDFQTAIHTEGEYGNNYSKLLKEIEVILPKKKIYTQASDLEAVRFKTGENYNIYLYPEDLSHGELKRLGIYLWMKNHKIHNSIILIDELEIGLHPDWQYQIIEDLKTFFPDNQYIIATHSYDICEAVTPAHVKELSPEFKLRTAQ